jgi:hypothetical protein
MLTNRSNLVRFYTGIENIFQERSTVQAFFAAYTFCLDTEFHGKSFQPELCHQPGSHFTDLLTGNSLLRIILKQTGTGLKTALMPV